MADYKDEKLKEIADSEKRGSTTASSTKINSLLW